MESACVSQGTIPAVAPEDYWSFPKQPPGLVGFIGDEDGLASWASEILQLQSSKVSISSSDFDNFVSHNCKK